MSGITLLFIVLFVLIVIGVPIGVALGVATLVGFAVDHMSLIWFSQRLFSTFDSFPLLALPFFILAGDIMQHGTMADNLRNLCQRLAGHLKAALAQISTLTCLFYGTLCGSAPATTAAIGSFMIPAMEEEKYPKSLATAVNTVSGVLGVMIPPSVPLILYGASGMISITDLFIAGVLPGIMVCVAFMITTNFICRRHGYGKIHPRATWKEKFAAIWNSKYSILVPIIVLGSIYTGICTPTEAGAIACGYAFFVETFITRCMSWKLLYKILSSSLATISMIFLMMIMANAMGTYLQMHHIDRVMIEYIHAFTTSPALFMLLMLVFLLILGTFMDATASILILTPLLVPIAVSYGINPVQFGIFMIVSLSLGFLTPPVGISLFVGSSLSGLPLMALSRAVVPYLFAMLIVIFIIMYVPAVSLLFL